MVVAWASLAFTCAWISASQSILVVVLVPEVVDELAPLEVAVVAVELVLLTDVMTVPLNQKAMGRRNSPAHPGRSLSPAVSAGTAASGLPRIRPRPLPGS